MATVDPASGGCLARETFVQEESDVTVIVVTSPSPSFPSTKLIDTCLLSVYEKIQYLKRSKTIIVLDGYKLHHENKLKQGKITREYKDQYDLYFAALKMKYSGPQFRIERLQRHMVGCSQLIHVNIRPSAFILPLVYLSAFFLYH